MSTYKELIQRASLTSDEKTDARSDFDEQKEWQEQLVAFALEETPNPEQLARYIKRKISKPGHYSLTATTNSVLLAHMRTPFCSPNARKRQMIDPSHSLKSQMSAVVRQMIRFQC
jgi:hypothetical protein